MTANEQARIAFGKLLDRMPYDELREFTEELIEKARNEHPFPIMKQRAETIEIPIATTVSTRK